MLCTDITKELAQNVEDCDKTNLQQVDCRQFWWKVRKVQYGPWQPPSIWILSTNLAFWRFPNFTFPNNTPRSIPRMSQACFQLNIEGSQDRDCSRLAAGTKELADNRIPLDPFGKHGTIHAWAERLWIFSKDSEQWQGWQILNLTRTAKRWGGVRGLVSSLAMQNQWCQKHQNRTCLLYLTPALQDQNAMRHLILTLTCWLHQTLWQSRLQRCARIILALIIKPTSAASSQ